MGQKHKKIQRQFHSDVMNLIETENDLSVVALKGQLYAEYWLNEVMLATWGEKASEIVNQFSYAKKITIAKATGLIDNGPLLETLVALSEIRNKMTHNLVPENPVSMIQKLPPYLAEPYKREFSRENFDSETDWALVYLKIAVIVTCIPLISHYYVPKSKITDSGEWATRLKKIAIDRLRPKGQATQI